jgi:hypothetical protein
LCYIDLHMGLMQTLLLMDSLLELLHCVDIVVDVLICRDKLFNWYIFILHGLHLIKIMDGFFHACGLPNVCGTIDGSHILFSQKSNKWVIAIVCTNYYYRWRGCNLVVLQATYDMDKFWNVRCSVPSGMSNWG